MGTMKTLQQNVFFVVKPSGKKLQFHFEEPVDPAFVEDISIYEENDFRYRLYRKYQSKPNTLYYKGTFNSYGDMIVWAHKQK